MARVHGKNVNYLYNSVALEVELNSVTMTFDVSPADITSFTDTWGNSLSGKKNTKTDITGTLDMAAGAGEVTLWESFGSGGVATVLELTGSSAGANDPSYEVASSGLTGVLLESLNISIPVGGTATYTATLQHSGSTTRETS